MPTITRPFAFVAILCVYLSSAAAQSLPIDSEAEELKKLEAKGYINYETRAQGTDGKVYVGEYTFVRSALLPAQGRTGYAFFTCRNPETNNGFSFSGQYLHVGRSGDVSKIRVWWSDANQRLDRIEDIELDALAHTIRFTTTLVNEGNRVNRHGSSVEVKSLRGAYGKFVDDWVRDMRQSELRQVLHHTSGWINAPAPTTE